MLGHMHRIHFRCVSRPWLEYLGTHRGAIGMGESAVCVFEDFGEKLGRADRGTVLSDINAAGISLIVGFVEKFIYL